MDGTVRQLELVSAERSASPQTHTFCPWPAASVPTNQRRLKFELTVLKLTYTLNGRCLSKVKGSGSVQAQERWPVRKDVKLPSPPIHLAVFRDPDVYGFSYNNTQAVGGGETVQQGLVSTGLGIWKWQQVENDVGSQKPHNHHSGASAFRHTQGAQRPETRPRPRWWTSDISTRFLDMFLQYRIKSITEMKETTAQVP